MIPLIGWCLLVQSSDPWMLVIAAINDFVKQLLQVMDIPRNQFQFSLASHIQWAEDNAVVSVPVAF